MSTITRLQLMDGRRGSNEGVEVRRHERRDRCQRFSWCHEVSETGSRYPPQGALEGLRRRGGASRGRESHSRPSARTWAHETATDHEIDDAIGSACVPAHRRYIRTSRRRARAAASQQQAKVAVGARGQGAEVRIGWAAAPDAAGVRRQPIHVVWRRLAHAPPMHLYPTLQACPWAASSLRALLLRSLTLTSSPPSSLAVLTCVSVLPIGPSQGTDIAGPGCVAHDMPYARSSTRLCSMKASLSLSPFATVFPKQH